MFMKKHEFQIFLKKYGKDSIRDAVSLRLLGTSHVKYSVGCVYPMFVDPRLPHAEFGPNGHQEDALHFIFWILSIMIPSKIKKRHVRLRRREFLGSKVLKLYFSTVINRLKSNHFHLI